MNCLFLAYEEKKTYKTHFKWMRGIHIERMHFHNCKIGKMKPKLISGMQAISLQDCNVLNWINTKHRLRFLYPLGESIIHPHIVLSIVTIYSEMIRTTTATSFLLRVFN